MLGQIFTKAQNKITDPAKLFRLIDMVDGEKWVMLDADVKGDIYEGLLERNAEDTKSGAGQYFTPRALMLIVSALCIAALVPLLIVIPLDVYWDKRMRRAFHRWRLAAKTIGQQPKS
ncbi:MULTISPECIES: N-6 DNA methylase [Paracoccus]|uniref:N-6 DNA methylase n=1 Tax=Paracoccus TaxID=265 RepID=UPI0007DC16DF|nr:MULTISPECIES: N-6 DNA methylase [Paracoccus]|tara:strand:+ start:3816 stop:4166 length:351 start_codon:yes stop_codon:yes gene_type:complete